MDLSLVSRELAGQLAQGPFRFRDLPVRGDDCGDALGDDAGLSPKGSEMPGRDGNQPPLFTCWSACSVTPLILPVFTSVFPWRFSMIFSCFFICTAWLLRA